MSEQRHKEMAEAIDKQVEEDTPKCSSCDKDAVYEIQGEDSYCCEVCLGMWYKPDIRRL